MKNNNKKEKKTIKDVKNKQAKKQKSFSNVLEGKEAINALANALDADGLLNDDTKNTQNLQKRIDKLEHEIELIKTLIAKSIHLNGVSSSVLNG
jgi:DNA-directed RNA polymerase specialized sigma54-like protein